MENRGQDVLLSIIIPAYNVEPYIKECLDSIFDNLTPDQADLVEIIVVNDGSTDGTGAVLESYGKRDNLVFLTQRNRGISHARNAGIKTAAGKYLMFVDSDDYLVPGSLHKLLAFLVDNESVDIIEYDFYEFICAANTLKNKRETPSLSCGKGQEIYAAWVNDSFFRHLVWTKIVLKDLVTKNKIFFYEGIFHEDDEWTPKIFAFAQKVVYLPLHVYVYRIREGSVMSKMTRKNYFDKVKVFDSLVLFSSGENFSNEYVRALKCSASSIFWELLSAIKFEGKYDEELIGEITSREYIMEYSSTFHRRFFYRLIVKWLGVKAFYFFKYSIKNSFLHKK